MAWPPRPPARPRAGTRASKEKKPRGGPVRRSLISLLFGRSPKEAGPDAVDQASEWLDSVAADLDRGPRDERR